MMEMLFLPMANHSGFLKTNQPARAPLSQGWNTETMYNMHAV